MTTERELSSGQFLLNDFVICPENDQIIYQKESYKLEPKAMAVLMYLVENRHRIVSMQELLDRVWEGVVVTPQTAQRCISMIRKVFKNDENKKPYIHTFSKKGYQLALDPVFPEGAKPVEPVALPQRNLNWIAIFGSLSLVALLALWWFWPHSATRLFADEEQIFAFSLHPDQQHIAYIHRDFNTHEMTAFVRDKDGQPWEIAKLGKPTPMVQVRWSQSGSKIVILSQAIQSKVLVLPVDVNKQMVGRPIVSFEDEQYDYRRIDFSSENSLLFTRTPKDKYQYRLMSYQLDTAEVKEVVPGQDVVHFDIEHGRLAYAVEDEFQHHLHLVDLTTSQALAKATDDKIIVEIEWLPDGAGVLYRTEQALSLFKIGQPILQLIELGPRWHDFEISANGQVYYTIKNDVRMLANRPAVTCCDLEFSPSLVSQYQGVWDPSFQSMVFVSERTGLPQIWRWQNGELTQLSQFPQRKALSDLHWSSDAQWILFKADKDIYASSVVVKSSELLVSNQLYVTPLGFSKDNSEFYYQDINGFEVKVWRQGLSVNKKDFIQLPDESQVILLEGVIYYKTKNGQDLFRMAPEGAELVSSDFPKEARFIRAEKGSIYYNVFARHQIKNILAFDVASKQHRNVAERRAYNGLFLGPGPDNQILLEQDKELNRMLYQTDLERVLSRTE